MRIQTEENNLKRSVKRLSMNSAQKLEKSTKNADYSTDVTLPVMIDPNYNQEILLTFLISKTNSLISASLISSSCSVHTGQMFSSQNYVS